MAKETNWGNIIPPLIIGLSIGFFAMWWLFTYSEDNEEQDQEVAINAFIEALERENCQVARVPIWQLEVKNFSAKGSVLVNTNNIRTGNITFKSNNGVNSIKIPGGNYPWLDAVKLMRSAVQKNRSGIE